MNKLFHKGLALLLVVIVAGCGEDPQSAPTAFNQTVHTNEDAVVSITLSAEKAEGVDSAVSYLIKDQPQYGSLTGPAPNINYSPPAGFVGADHFTFEASQESVASNTATVTIIVVPAVSIKETRPEPAYLRKAQPLSTTELRLEWMESVDESTLPSQIQYDIHISQVEDFFPNQDNIVASKFGETSAVIAGLEPGFRYYAKVVAIDSEGNRSLETKPLSVKMPYQSFSTREDVNIYLASDFLENPVFDEESAVIEFEITEEFLPEVDEYILLDADDGSRIYRVESVDLVGLSVPSVIATDASLIGRSVRIGVVPSDIREIAAYGDVNISVSHDTNSGGFRYGGLPFDAITGTIGDIYEYTETNFNCMDENKQNPRITIFKGTESSFLHLDGGVEIACDISLEINNNYGYNLDQYPDIEEAEPEVLKGGSIRTTGDVRFKLFANMGFNVAYDSRSKTIWEKMFLLKELLKLI